MKDDVEFDAREAAIKHRESPNEMRAQLRQAIVNLIELNYNMTQISAITGIKRTTLYYIMWGRDGRRNQVKSRRGSALSNLQLHGEDTDLREVA